MSTASASQSASEHASVSPRSSQNHALESQKSNPFQQLEDGALNARSPPDSNGASSPETPIKVQSKTMDMLDRMTLQHDLKALALVRNSYGVLSPGPSFSALDREMWGGENCLLWAEIKGQAAEAAKREPMLGSYYYSYVLKHKRLAKALAYLLASKLAGEESMGVIQWIDVIETVFFENDPELSIRMAIREDLVAIKAKDVACTSLVDAFLFYRGFLGLQAHRVAHCLWQLGRIELARLLQSRIATVFSMDIHPAAKLGSGLLFDHASGVVIGETAQVGNGCSFLHNVTLGGTGKHGGDRHPKLGSNVSVGAGVSILGNIKIGNGAKIGAGSVVLKDVPEGCTAVGIPSRIIAVAPKEQKTD